MGDTDLWISGGAARRKAVGGREQRYVSGSDFHYSAADLDRFRRVQRLAYDMALRVESQLQVGITEIEACTLVAAAQTECEVIQVFHDPYVLFDVRTVLATGPDAAPSHGRAGDRPSSSGMSASTDLVPTDQVLREGAPFIVDLAPVAHGVSSDIAYSCVLGTNPVFDELDAGLARIRSFLRDGIAARTSMLTLYHELDERLAARGWESCHHRQADRALGHLMFPLEHETDRPTPLPGWGTVAAEKLLAAGIDALDHGTCYPLWNDSSFTDYPATPGLWAIEPHIGLDGVGVKFEELLVVTNDDAYWLDDDLPHVQRWKKAGYDTSPLRATSA
jgi:Xaa-Pro aminopeptidase